MQTPLKPSMRRSKGMISKRLSCVRLVTPALISLASSMAKRRYTHLPDKKLHRPYVELSLSNPETNKETPWLWGWLDSGSDICLAPMNIAIWLGIQFDGSEEDFSISTVSGVSQAIKKEVIFLIDEGQNQCPFFFVEGLSLDQPILLGQRGFFDHFQVCFDFPQKTFEIFL